MQKSLFTDLNKTQKQTQNRDAISHEIKDFGERRQIHHILSLSGGKDSTALALHVKDIIDELCPERPQRLTVLRKAVNG